MNGQHIQCAYCLGEAVIVSGSFLFPQRRQAANKLFYYCAPCEAWVGCHEGTSIPLGRVADSELRLWRQKAHAAFDAFWRRDMAAYGKKMARTRAYEWLSRIMRMDDCHIGGMSLDQCKRAVAFCQERKINERWRTKKEDEIYRIADSLLQKNLSASRPATDERQP